MPQPFHDADHRPISDKPISAPRHFGFVDALRGYAIVGVLAIHCSLQVTHLPPRLRDILSLGGYGVQLFFVVSACTLFWSLRTRIHLDSRPFASFFIRRLFRIIPLFWAGIIFYLHFPSHFTPAFAPNGVGWYQITATALLVHGWYPTSINSVVPGGWSIGAECMFYLCVPVLFLRIKNLLGALWAVLLSAVLAALVGQAEPFFASHFPSSWTNLIHSFLYFSFPNQLPVFCLGVVTYFLLLDCSDGTRRFPIQSKHLSIFLLAAAAYFAIFGIQPYVLLASAFLLLAWGLALGRHQFIVNPVIQFLGTISYSIYIWHFAVVDAVAPFILNALHPSKRVGVNGTLQFAVIFLVVSASAALISVASYHAIEVPGQQLGKWVILQLGWGSASGSRRRVKFTTLDLVRQGASGAPQAA